MALLDRPHHAQPEPKYHFKTLWLCLAETRQSTIYSLPCSRTPLEIHRLLNTTTVADVAYSQANRPLHDRMTTRIRIRRLRRRAPCRPTSAHKLQKLAIVFAPRGVHLESACLWAEKYCSLILNQGSKEAHSAFVVDVIFTNPYIRTVLRFCRCLDDIGSLGKTG